MPRARLEGLGEGEVGARFDGLGEGVVEGERERGEVWCPRGVDRQSRKAQRTRMFPDEPVIVGIAPVASQAAWSAGK